MVTAGHCAGSNSTLILFNVPKSLPNRQRVFPGPEDQYPIGNFVTPFNGSAATDWAVFTAGQNSQTGLTPIQAQGKFFNVVQSDPVGPITITGYGSDTGADNATQQTHTGPLVRFDRTFVRYTADTQGGNSGSPIIDSATGNAVGVHAYGGCRTNGGSNFGERSTIPAFWEAMGLNTTNPPGGDCEELNFSDVQISSFSNQDRDGDAAITNNGQAISLRNNTWKVIPYAYTVTEETILEVTFRSTSEGEIHAIGFESDNELSANLYFKLHGTQDYGIPDFDTYSGNASRTYKIPVGAFYTGTASRMVFINDNDQGGGNTSVFSNVKVYEGSCENSNRSSGVVEVGDLEPESGIKLGTEDEGSLGTFTLLPNPTKDAFQLTVTNTDPSTNVRIYNILGQKKNEFIVQNGVTNLSAVGMGLTPGMYLVEAYNEDGDTKVTKLIISN